MIYDLGRKYGYFYDLVELREMDSAPPMDKHSGRLDDSYLAEDEQLMQEAWRSYFKSISIPGRANPKLQRRFMPKRFWPYLTEKQD